MLLSGRGFALNKGCCNPVFTFVDNIIHQAMGNPRNGIWNWHLAHIHYKMTYSYIHVYTQKITVPDTPTKLLIRTHLYHTSYL